MSKQQNEKIMKLLKAIYADVTGMNSDLSALQTKVAVLDYNEDEICTVTASVAKKLHADIQTEKEKVDGEAEFIKEVQQRILSDEARILCDEAGSQDILKQVQTLAAKVDQISITGKVDSKNTWPEKVKQRMKSCFPNLLFKDDLCATILAKGNHVNITTDQLGKVLALNKITNATPVLERFERLLKVQDAFLV